jgi:hypothetical protein
MFGTNRAIANLSRSGFTVRQVTAAEATLTRPAPIVRGRFNGIGCEALEHVENVTIANRGHAISVYVSEERVLAVWATVSDQKRPRKPAALGHLDDNVLAARRVDADFNALQVLFGVLEQRINTCEIANG